jgi:hypothetical protein
MALQARETCFIEGDGWMLDDAMACAFLWMFLSSSGGRMRTVLINKVKDAVMTSASWGSSFSRVPVRQLERKSASRYPFQQSMTRREPCRWNLRDAFCGSNRSEAVRDARVLRF